jgi:uncharacterized protein YoxC
MEVTLDALALVLLVGLVVFIYIALKEIDIQLKNLRADTSGLVSRLRVVSAELQAINVQVAKIAERINSRTALGTGFDLDRR